MRDIRYDALGQLVFDAVPADAVKVLLYAELEPGVALVSIFYQDGEGVRYVDPSDEVFREVERLHARFEQTVRAFEFELVGEEFRVSFTYADRFDENSDDLRRREAILSKHFGSANIIYSQR